MCDGHSHDHSHDHAHDHVPGGEVTVAPQGGPVILDVGGNVGAMIVHLDRDWLGHEIHVRLVGDDGSLSTSTVHTGVWERQLGWNTMVVAVFCELVEGNYWLLDRGGEPIVMVSITGGMVTETSLAMAAAHSR
jgi:hypothetical protein